MSAGTPWSVKGIDPKAREVAKSHARRAGLTLGSWLNQVILEDDTPDEVTHEGQMARAAPRLDRPRLRTLPAATFAEGAEPPGRVADALNQLADRLEASETRTGLAIQSVEQALRGVVARIEVVERGQATPAAGPLAEDALARLGDRIAGAEAATGRALDNLAAALEGLDRRVAAAERGGDEAAARRFEALARTLTQQVEAERRDLAERLAAVGPGGLDKRLDELTRDVRAVEARAVGAVEAIGRQVLAMAEAVSRKLTEVDDRSATAIDQVGAEVARIAGAVELRLARGEQVQAQSFERLNAELARVAETLNARLVATESGVVAPQPAPVASAAPPPAIDPATVAAFGAPPAPEPEAATPETATAAEAAPTESDADADVIDPPWRRLDLDVPDAETPESFAPLPDATDDDLFDPAPTADGLSTREVIERARAAARAAQAAPADGEAASAGRIRTGFGTRAASGRLFQGFGGKPRRPPGSTLQTALLIAGGAAFLSMGAAGLTLMQDGEEPTSPTAAAPPAAASTAPRVAMARAPTALLGEAPAFERVRADVEAGEAGALARLQALAGAGHAQARLYLAQLYDAGEAGLPRDPAEARKLTALAAEAGEPRAMHNLGVYLFRGEGGPQDLALAVDWFRKAAAAGIVESQYNLGLVYQSGAGAARDLSQARYWFRLAAARGDAEARKALASLEAASARPAPAPDAPRPAPVAAREPAPSLNVRQNQIVLSRLGYYDGPVDGRASEAYRLALNAYQTDLAASPAARR